MTARRLLIPGYAISRDANGRALPAKAYFYAPDAAYSTPASVYTSEALGTAHSFPVLSDSFGRFPALWADDGETFDVQVTDQATGRQLATFSDLSPADDAVLASVEAAEASADAAQAAADDAEASAVRAEAVVNEVTGEPFTGTSVTELTIGTGAKSLTLTQTGKLFSAGQTIVVASTASPSNQMIGVVQTAVGDTGAITFTSSLIGGSGTFSSWTVSLSSAAGVVSLGGVSGILSAAQGRAAIGFDAETFFNGAF